MTFNWKRFVGVFLAAIVALALISQAALMLFNFDIQSSAMGIIPIMVAAMVEGQKHAQGTKDPIPRIWRQSAMMAGIALVINLVLALGYLAFSPGARQMIIDAPIILVAVLVIFGLVFWLVARGFFGMGANITWKAQSNGK